LEMPNVSPVVSGRVTEILYEQETGLWQCALASALTTATTAHDWKMPPNLEAELNGLILALCWPLSGQNMGEIRRTVDERSSLNATQNKDINQQEAAAVVDGVAKSASPEVAVRLLTSDQTGSAGLSKYMEEFFLTYRSFLEPERLLALLIAEFVVYADLDSVSQIESPKDQRSATMSSLPKHATDAEQGQRNTVNVVTDVDIIRGIQRRKLRSANALRFWVENHGSRDFDPPLTASFVAAVFEFVLFRDKKLARFLLGAVGRCLRLVSNTGHRWAGHHQGPVLSKDWPPVLRPAREGRWWHRKVLRFLAWPPLEVARQLSLRESTLFQNVKLYELLDCAWSKPDKATRAPGILALTANFNEIAAWAVASILHAERSSDRAFIISFFIEVAHECAHSLNNFATARAIVAGLSNAAVHRLKQSWEQVPAAQTENIKALSALFDTARSYAAIRAALRDARPPCIPYLGIYLTDLTFIADGNPSRTATGEVNLVKNRLTAQVIAKMQLYQQEGRYSLHPDVPLQQLIASALSAKFQDDEVLFKRSLEVEPRT